MAAKRKVKTTSISWFKLLLALLIVCAVVQIGRFQLQIAAQRRELAQLEEQIETQQAKNNEVSRLLEMGDDKEYLKQIAIEEMGFAYSDEKIYIDISGS